MLFWSSCFIAIITFIKYEFAKNFQKNLIAYPNVQAALKSVIIKFDKLGLTMYVFDCVYFTTTKYRSTYVTLEE